VVALRRNASAMKNSLKVASSVVVMLKVDPVETVVMLAEKPVRNNRAYRRQVNA